MTDTDVVPTFERPAKPVDTAPEVTQLSARVKQLEAQAAAREARMQEQLQSLHEAMSPEVIVREPTQLFKNPNKRAFGWVDKALETISQARSANPDFDHGHHTETWRIDKAMRDRQEGKRTTLDARDLQHIRHAEAKAEQEVGLRRFNVDSTLSVFEQITQLLRQLPPSARGDFLAVAKNA